MKIQTLLNQIYDLGQQFSGSEQLKVLFRKEVGPAIAQQGLILDIGGGTGLYRSIFPLSWRYVCLDCDYTKLSGFKKRHPHDHAIQGSAVRLPLRDHSVDLCLMIFVTHHLSPHDLHYTLREIARILRRDGRLFLADAVWNPANIRGRCLWWLDRGSYKKTASELVSLAAGSMEIAGRKQIRIIHDYEFFWCQPKG